MEFYRNLDDPVGNEQNIFIKLQRTWVTYSHYRKECFLSENIASALDTLVELRRFTRYTPTQEEMYVINLYLTETIMRVKYDS